MKKFKKYKNKSGGKMQSNDRLIKKVAEVYDWLDSQIRNNSDLAGRCDACGRCCVFDKPDSVSERGFDHRLFLTTPELMYLIANIGAEGARPMLTSRCPYNVDGKCSVYEYRFAGCRIFYCKGDSATHLADKKDFQSRLSESVLKKFRTICEEFGIAYRYIDLATALNKTPGKTGGLNPPSSD